jgi:hypothetical protein
MKSPRKNSTKIAKLQTVKFALLKEHEQVVNPSVHSTFNVKNKNQVSLLSVFFIKILLKFTQSKTISNT